MGFAGDIASLERLAHAAERLAQVPALAAKRVADGIYELIADQFDSGTDPYGTTWEPLAEATLAKGRHDPPLTDTSGLRDSLNVYARASGGELSGGVAISIGRPDHPAAPHQEGWTGSQGDGPARPILPDRAEIPATWSELIETSVSEAVDHEFEGAFQ